MDQFVPELEAAVRPIIPQLLDAFTLLIYALISALGGVLLRFAPPFAKAWLNERLAAVTGRAIMLSRGKVRELTHPRWVASNGTFSQASGWTPRIPLADGISGLFES